MRQPDNRAILIVEDDHDDFSIILKALEAEGLAEQAYRIVFGPDAIDYLDRKMGHQKHEGEPLPQLILTDLRLPGIDGCDLIRAIRSRPMYRHIPIVVVTGSDDEGAAARCYEIGVAGFFCKPFSHQDFIDDLRAILNYWTKVCVVPELAATQIDSQDHVTVR
jgi:CheY-like chemotaxis protein